MSTPTKRTTILVPKDYHCSWKIHAAQMGISMNEFALRALFSAFENLGIDRQPSINRPQMDLFRKG